MNGQPPRDRELRRCGRCGALKPLGDFAWRRKSRNQLDNYCRPCRADYKHEHYAANRERYIADALRRKRELAVTRSLFLIAYFRTHPCADCGETDPVILEFDHRGDKEFAIGANLRDRRWEDILAEIAKCDVVCANCHRRRTAAQRGFVRLAALQTSGGELPPTAPQN